MAVWKQILVALVVLGVAAVAWVKFFPGAPDLLSKWGIEVPQALARTEAPATTAAGGERRSGGAGGGAPGQGPQTAVITDPVERATINDKLNAIGTGRAVASVTVNPYTNGRLTEVLVDSGATVKAGDILGKLDSEAEEIALDRTRVALTDTDAALARINTLRSSNTASAVQVTEAQLAQSNAQLALRDAELTLERRSIRAPIDGVVGIVQVEAGNYVTTQTAILTIDDRSTIKVDFFVPERFADAVKVGAPLTAVPVARPNEALQGAVTAVDNRLDEASRTLRVQAGIDNSGDTLRAGMSFQVMMSFPGDSYPAVSPLAVQWGADGAFVWVVRDGKARRTPIRIIQRNTESVLVEGDVASGETVVTEGVQVVRDGAAVLVAGDDPAPKPTPVAQGGT